MSAYRKLLNRYPLWDFLIDNEITLMLSQVNKYNEPPYELDPAGTDRIGYKVLDAVSYEVSYADLRLPYNICLFIRG